MCLSDFYTREPACHVVYIYRWQRFGLFFTFETPPFFAVLAHGMAAVAFWRVVQLFWIFEPQAKVVMQKILISFQNKKRYHLNK